MIKVNSSLRGLLFNPVIFFSILFFVSCHEEINDVSPGTGSLLEEVIKKYSVQEITTQFGGGQADLLPLGMEASWEKAYEDNGVIIVPVRDSILSLCHAVGYYIFSRPHTAIVVKSLIYFNQGDTLIQCTNDTLINPFQTSFEGMIWELGQGDYILGMYEIRSGQLTRSLQTQTHMDEFVEFLNERSGSATTRSCDRCWGESWWAWFWHCFNVRLDVMEGGVADFFESLWNFLSDADRRQFPGYDPSNPGSSFFGFIDFISGGGVASGGGGNGGSGVPRYLGAEYDAFMSDCQSWIAWKVAAEQEGLPPGVSESDWKLCELFSDQTLGLHHFIKLCVFKNRDILSVVNDYWEQSAKDAESAALIKRYLEQVCLSDYPISLNQWLEYEGFGQGLTYQEWLKYLEDRECKNSSANKPTVDQFKSQLSQAIENELRQLAIDFPGVPLDVDLLKSVISKVIFKRTGKLIPLVGVGFDVVELRAAYAAGDYVAMGLSIGSILTEIIPCAMIVDVVFDAASIGNAVLKAYKSFSELKIFLGNNSGVYKAIEETIDELGLIDALEWAKKGSSNIGQFAVSLGGKSVEEFLELLAMKLGKTWTPSGNAKYIDIPGVIINYYPSSSSGSIPTIQIIIGGIEFKIRLNI